MSLNMLIFGSMRAVLCIGGNKLEPSSKLPWTSNQVLIVIDHTPEI